MSDAEKLAEEIVRALEGQLDAFDALQSRGSFAALDRADKLRPGVAHALDLAREVVARWKGEHDRPAS